MNGRSAPPAHGREPRPLGRGGILLFLAGAAGGTGTEPIKAHPSNPHHFLYKGQPTILITSAEHYGAVINKDFDYVVYFDALQAHQLNYTRIYPGVMFELVAPH